MARITGAHAEEATVEVEVLPHRELTVECVRLGHDPDELLRDGRMGYYVDTGDVRRARRRYDSRGEHSGDGGLARAVGTEQSENLAGLHREIEFVHCSKVRPAVDLREIFGENDRRRARVGFTQPRFTHGVHPRDEVTAPPCDVGPCCRERANASSTASSLVGGGLENLRERGRFGDARVGQEEGGDDREHAGTERPPKRVSKRARNTLQIVQRGPDQSRLQLGTRRRKALRDLGLQDDGEDRDAERTSYLANDARRGRGLGTSACVRLRYEAAKT